MAGSADLLVGHLTKRTKKHGCAGAAWMAAPVTPACVEDGAAGRVSLGSRRAAALYGRVVLNATTTEER